MTPRTGARRTDDAASKRIAAGAGRRDQRRGRGQKGPFSAGLVTCVLLAALTVAAYGRVRQLGFVNFDDPEYVSENRHVLEGLGWPGVAWAFTATEVHNWHPLTWISLMLDASLGGVDAEGAADPRVFHTTNLLLHVANVLLLFFLLDRMTGARWRCAAVAALFAIHPLHVESVAWIAERKDVLSALFGLLTLAAYLRYVRRPSAGRYGAVAAVFALGLMAKPMLVTLPLVLILLDYWPLRRWGPGSLADVRDAGVGRARTRPGDVAVGASSAAPPHGDAERPGRLDRPAPWSRMFAGAGASSSLGLPTAPAAGWKRVLLEKLPLLALSAASSAVAVFAQRGAIQTLDRFPIGERALNALVSYAAYMGKMVWPRSLAIPYPYPQARPLWEVGAAVLLLLAISTASVLLARSRPWLAVGWFWYLVTLVPVIGLVQVGRQPMADRYTYLPLIGLFLVLAWGLPDLLRSIESFARRPRMPRTRTATAEVPGSTGISGPSGVSSAAPPPEKPGGSGPSATSRTLAGGRQDTRAAPPHPRAGDPGPSATLRILTGCGVAVVLALAACTWIQAGRWRSSIELYTHALDVTRDNAVAHNNLAMALGERGDIDPSIAHLREALRIDPRLVEAHFNLTRALIGAGKAEEAAALCREEQASWPSDERTFVDLGLLAMLRKRYDEAAAHFSEALRADPDSLYAHLNLASIRAGQGRDQEARAHFAAVERILGPERARRIGQRGIPAGGTNAPR